MPLCYSSNSGSKSVKLNATIVEQRAFKVDDKLLNVVKMLNSIQFEGPKPVGRDIRWDHRGDWLPPRIKAAEEIDNFRPQDQTGCGRYSGKLNLLQGTTDNPTAPRKIGSGTKKTHVGTDNPTAPRKIGSGTKKTHVGTNNPITRWMSFRQQAAMENSWMSSKI